MKILKFIDGSDSIEINLADLEEKPNIQIEINGSVYFFDDIEEINDVIDFLRECKDKINKFHINKAIDESNQ